MNALAHESALLVCLGSATILWALAVAFRMAHETAQPFGFRAGFAAERGTWWAAARKFASLLMWYAIATAALSLVLNVIRFAKGAP